KFFRVHGIVSLFDFPSPQRRLIPCSRLYRRCLPSAMGAASQGRRAGPPSARGDAVRPGRTSMFEDRQQHLDEDEEDDNEFEKLRAEVRALHGDDLIDALEHVELSLDVLFPRGEMETRSEQAIGP